jgi:hypothetical protein
MIQSEIIREIDSALTACAAASSKASDDASLQKVLYALQSIRGKVVDHWPLTPEERININIGIFAVREMEGMYDDLVEILTRLDYHLVTG